MSTYPALQTGTATFPSPGDALEEPQWYAVQTRARHEKKADWHLQAQGIATYLPLLTELHRWSDRRKYVQIPLFPCYTFVQMRYRAESHHAVLRTPGVVRLVGNGRIGQAIPEKQIEDIRKVLSTDVSYEVLPFVAIGERVRISGGCLDGIEGLLVARNRDRSLVISVEPIHRSLTIRIGDYKIEKA